MRRCVVLAEPERCDSSNDSLGEACRWIIRVGTDCRGDHTCSAVPGLTVPAGLRGSDDDPWLTPSANDGTDLGDAQVT